MPPRQLSTRRKEGRAVLALTGRAWTTAAAASNGAAAASQACAWASASPNGSGSGTSTIHSVTDDRHRRTPQPTARPARAQPAKISAALAPDSGVTCSCAYGGAEKPAVVNHAAIAINRATPGSATAPVVMVPAAARISTQPAETRP